jgi:hypothetical protein
MAKRSEDLDRLLRHWPFEPGEVSARLVRAGDGRQVLLMRVELGVLQMEVEGRPDGHRPHGCPTYFEHLRRLPTGPDFRMNDDQCTDADREFLQFYHRRLCWLALREFRRAAADADHTLAFMDFVRRHSPDEEWTRAHEQYRPFVLFHRTQAAALAALEETTPEAAVEELGRGLDSLRQLFIEHQAEDHYDDDEMVQRLVDLRDSIRAHYHVQPSLVERLATAVANEEYELAARLRDEIARRARSA